MQAHQNPNSKSAALAEVMAARNLQFLAVIENTLDGLESDTGHIRVIAEAVEKTLKSLQAENSPKPVDPEGRLSALLEKASESARRMYATASEAHESACSDRMLKPEDGVVEAFNEHLEALTDLHACGEELRDWIETHDALLEPSTGKTYTNVDDLFAAMGL